MMSTPFSNVHLYVVVCWVVALFVLGGSQQAAAVVLQNMINPEITVELGPGDGLIAVDYWTRRSCPPKVAEFDEFAEKSNELITRARAKGATIVFAQGSAQKTYNAKTKVVKTFWTVPDKRERKLYGIVNSQAQKAQKAAKGKFPIPLIMQENKVGCPVKKTSVDRKLHPSIQVDRENDIMFGDGYFFKHLRKANLNRLFYTGKALNLCVLQSRRFSAVEASISRKGFTQIGLIVDYCDPTYEPSTHCIGIDKTECVDKFVRWIHTSFTKGRVSFWKVLSL